MQSVITPSGVSVAIAKTMALHQTSNPLVEEKKNKSDFSIKIANTLKEREAAFQLAYQVYLDKGYSQKNADGWLVKDYDKNASTAIFIVKDSSKKIIATATLVFNDQSDLPTAKIYANEILNLSTSGKKIVEVSRLVVNPEFRNSKEILVLLFNYMFIYGYHVMGFDSTIIQVNPRHIEFYKKLLKFKVAGAEKLCPSVANAPAILLYLPLSFYYSEVARYSVLINQDKKDRSLYPYFIKIEQENLVAFYLKNQVKPMSVEELSYFGFTESGISKAVCVM